MVTYLTALRFAPNIEAQLENLQRRRYSQTHDASTRFLPPLVPLHWSEIPISRSVLDEIRRRHSLLMIRQTATIADLTPPGTIPLALGNDGRKDFDALVAHLVVTAPRAEAALSPAARSENPGAPPLTSGARSPGTDPPAAGITLSWSDTEPGPSPIDLPGTSAFFLSHFEIIPGEQGAWWEGATWQELFSSRIANPGKERGR